MIELKNIQKKYDNNLVLKNVTATFEHGHVYGLIGRNGSGKSVLLNIICGLSSPTSGCVLYDGIDLYKTKKFLPNARALINGPGFLDNLSGLENLKLLANINSKIDEKHIIELLKEFDMEYVMEKKYKTYSFGMKQKIGIIQVIMEDPEIMIFDEPFNGLDDKSIEVLRKILLNYKKRKKIIIIATHMKDDLNLLCDKVYKINDGIILKVK